MKRTKLVIQDDQEFRLNRLACQHPLCFPPSYKPQRFVINRNRKNGFVLAPGGKDRLGHFNRKGNIMYAAGMALSDADQFIDRGENPLPGVFDHKVLMGLIYIAIKHRQYHVDFKSTYAILKALSLPINDKHYEMLWNSFDKWSKTSVMYQRSIRVYDDDKATTHKATLGVNAVISGIDSYWNSDKEEEGGIHIEFTPRFLQLLGIKFSTIGAYNNTVLKLKGASSLNLYLYLIGLGGFLEKGDLVKRNLKDICINKLSLNPNTRKNKMKLYLKRAILNINKTLKNGIYDLEFEKENVIFSYKNY